MNTRSFGGLRHSKDCGIWEGVFDFQVISLRGLSICALVFFFFSSEDDYLVFWSIGRRRTIQHTPMRSR